jgi:hypothetical protein
VGIAQRAVERNAQRAVAVAAATCSGLHLKSVRTAFSANSGQN